MSIKTRLEKLEGVESPMIGLAERLQVARERYKAESRQPQPPEENLNAIIATSKSN